MLAPLILRLSIGALFLIRGFDLIKHKDVNGSWKSFWQSRLSEDKIPKVIFIHGVVQCVIAAAMIFGFLTQVAAIFAIVFTLIEWQHDNENEVNDNANSKFSHLFVVLISLSLLFLGAGFLAIDLPL